MEENTEKPSEPSRGRVTVFGDSVFQAPLLDTEKARTVVIRDKDGQPVAFMARIVDDTWCFSSKADSDWNDVKIRFGVS